MLSKYYWKISVKILLEDSVKIFLENAVKILLENAVEICLKKSVDIQGYESLHLFIIYETQEFLYPFIYKPTGGYLEKMKNFWFRMDFFVSIQAKKKLHNQITFD